MVDYRGQTERIRMTKTYLAEGYEKMSVSNISLQNTSEALSKTSNRYQGMPYHLSPVVEYKGEIVKGSHLISDIEKK